MIYRFRKEDRDESADFDTSYSFRNRANYRKRWFTLNKKATTIVEKEDHLEVHLQDWYINANHNGKFNEQAYDRQYHCEELQKYYLKEKQKKDDK